MKTIPRITKHQIGKQIWYEFNTLHYCFFGFSLRELLSEIPNEFKNICLTQLN